MSSSLWRTRRRGERPLIYGREHERAQLRELLDDSIAGHGSLVLISGEAGIGKTTLVDDLIYEADQRDCLVLTGGCYDLTTTPPYGPWVEITRNYPDHGALPALPRQLQEGTGMEGVASRGMLFDLVGVFLAEIAGQRALTLIIEDLHWSDAESLSLLRHIARGIAAHAILIVATYRDDELTRRHQLFQLLPVLARESQALRVDLRALSLDALNELIRARYDLDPDATERLTDYLHTRTDGNPLFVDEMLHTLESERSLRDGPDAWTLDDLNDVPIPPLVIQLIEARLAQLEPETQQLLEVAAVIGQDIPIDLWSAVSGRAEQQLRNAVAQGISAHVIEEHSGSFTLRFRHALIREALYSRLVLLDRRRWHRAVAEELVRSTNPDPDMVVTHLERANDPRLGDWLMRAGERAMSQLAWDVAIDRLQQALDLLELQGLDDPVRYCNALLQLGEAQERLGAGAEQGIGAGNDPVSQSTFWLAADVARQHDLPEQLGRAALGVVGGNFAAEHGGSAGIRLVREALDTLPDTDTPLRVRLLTRWGFGAGLISFRDPATSAEGIKEAFRSWAEATRMARRLEDPRSIAYALAGQSIRYELSGDIDALLITTREIIDLARRAGDTEMLAWGLFWRHRPQLVRGELVAARDTMTEFASVVTQLQTRTFEWHLAVWRAADALAIGRFQEATDWIQRIHTIWARSAAGTQLKFKLSQEFDDTILLEDGIETANARSPEVDSRWFRWHSIRPAYAVERNDRAGARYFGDQIWTYNMPTMSVLDGLGGPYLRMLANLSEVAIWLDDQGRAHQIYELLLPYADRNIHAAYSDFFGDAVAHHLGLLAGFFGEWESAEAHFQLAIELESRWGTRPVLAWSYYHYASMLSHRMNPGDHSHAVELLDQASEIVDQLGMIRLQRLIAGAREQFGSEADESFPFGLSQREVEVLRLLVEGMTDGEIAEELYLSPRTISTYLSSIYNKLGVNSRAAAAAITVRSGLA